MRFLKQISLLALVALLGCQAQPPIEPQASVSINLPTEFSQSLQKSFQANSSLTAQRFLNAYDSFAKYSPVTQETVLDYARAHVSLQRGRILGGILAVDLNADGLITRTEFDTLAGLPNGHKQSARMAGLFEFDKNQDGSMTFKEAIQFGETLNAAHSEKALRPIESHLMLFDINADGVVDRDEVVKALYAHLPDSVRTAGDPSGNSPKP